MNAGDALWYLHAKVTMLERRYSTDPSTLELIAKMREDVTTLGEFIKVPPPPADKMQALIEFISTTLNNTSTPPQQEQAEPQKRSGGSPNSAPDRIAAVTTILDEMVSSGRYDWAEMVSDIHSRMHGDSPFITDRQCRAIRNIGYGGKNAEYWDQLADEYPEAMQILEAAAAKAD